jgi:hypothetical protein
MADEPAREDIEPLPELNEKNALRVSIHQSFLILYRQRLQALFELFNIEIQKLSKVPRESSKYFFEKANTEDQLV